MAQFMLILHETPGSFAKLSPTEIQGILEKYGAWTGQLAASGKLVGGQKLKDEGGKLISKAGDRLTVVDGPYSETKEVIGGYFVVKAADYDEAVRIASESPHLPYGRVEVRQVDFMGQPES
jgi:hypothetical protein